MAVYQTTIIGRKQITENTLELSFKRPKKFSFKAGQYIQLGVIKLLYKDYKGSSRVLSIASSPTDKERLSVAFRDTGSGFKQTLKELEIGSKIKIDGPYGFYTLPKHSSDSIIFIAGGIGIVPFLSMIRFASKSGGKNLYQLNLIYSNKDKRNSPYLNELQDYSISLKNFVLKTSFKRIDKQFLLDSVKNIRNCKFYISGPPAMVSSVRSLLHLLGVNSDKIYFEEFTGY